MDSAELGLSEEKINNFKEWVKSQSKRPSVWDARRWFHDPDHSHDEQDASLDQALGMLIDDAIEDSEKEMNDRSKVVFIFSLSFFYLPPSPSLVSILGVPFNVKKCMLTMSIGTFTPQNSWLGTSFALYAA